MSFNQLVLDTFDLRKVSRRATVLTLSAVAFTVISITYSESQGVDLGVLPYLLLFWAFVLIALLGGHSDTLFQHPAWRLNKIWKPMAFGVPVLVLGYALVALTTGWKPRGSIQELFLPALAWGVMVGTIEEFGFRWTLLVSLPYSILTSNILFALLHPAVRQSLVTGNPMGLFFFMAYLSFGLMLTGIVVAYEKSRWYKGNECFGPVLAIVWHAGHNIFATVWGASVGGLDVVAF